MSENNNSFECNTICWGIAAFVGFVSMIMLYMLADFGVLQSIFTGGLLGVVLGFVLIYFMCRDQKAAADLSSEEKPAQRYSREAAEDKEYRDSRDPVAETSGAATAATAATEPAPQAPAVPATPEPAESDASTETGATAAAASATPSSLMGTGIKPSTPLAGEAELATRKGEWKYESDAVKAPAKKAVAKKPAAEAPKPEAAAIVEPEPVAAKAEPAAAKAEAAPTATSSSGSAPQLYDAPPAEGADDLKLISGVGPKLEGTLNEMGIYRFAQVAVWGPSDIAWVDDRLRFKGRIERDDWMSQAKILAEGGETEFLKKKKK